MTACAAPRHQDEPEPAAPSARLCYRCTSGLRRDLRTLPQLYAGLGDILDPSNGGDGDGTGLHYNEPAFEAMSQIRHDLGWWTGWIARERRWLLPDPLTVPALAGWLHPQVRWASFRDLGALMADVFAQDRHRARLLLNPPPPGRIIIPQELNWCPRCETPAGLRIVYAAGSRQPEAVTCSACSYVWGFAQWLRLGREVLRWADTVKGAA